MRNLVKAVTRSHFGQVAERVVAGFSSHDDMSLAAAVAFYTVLSFAPLVLLMITFGAFLGGVEQYDLVKFFARQMGPRAAEVTKQIVENAKTEPPGVPAWRSALSIILLVLSASGVFGQLQTSLNHIWETDMKPRDGVWNWLRKRLLSLGMVLAALFILLTSLVLSATIDHFIPSGSGAIGRIVVFVTSFLVAAALFAAIFRVLPDRDIKWRHVWVGALITAGLFSIGKILLAIYLQSSVTESYGKAAGALLALLLWVYYSCVITFIGAEITRQVAGIAESEPAPTTAASAADSPAGSAASRRPSPQAE